MCLIDAKSPNKSESNTFSHSSTSAKVDTRRDVGHHSVVGAPHVTLRRFIPPLARQIKREETGGADTTEANGNNAAGRLTMWEYCDMRTKAINARLKQITAEATAATQALKSGSADAKQSKEIARRHKQELDAISKDLRDLVSRRRLTG